MTTTLQHGHEPDLNSPCAECVRQGEAMREARRPAIDRQAPVAPARDLEAYAASERFQTYVFEVAVQCRARACTFIHYVGDRFAHVRIAEDQARRHVAETGHEVEVLTHRVTAYRPRKER